MGAADNVLDILKVKIKPRRDGYTDQFSRVFLLKIMLLGAFITGVSWYSDSIKCMYKKEGTMTEAAGFISASCWINGLYIYEEIRDHDNAMGYYGIPKSVNMDGKHEISGKLCDSDGSDGESPQMGCHKMEKTYFVQFQYMTFFMSALAVLYYSPYAVFRLSNTDMNSLTDSVKAEESGDVIRKNFFNSKVVSRNKLNLYVAGNVLTKILYLVVNVAAFLLTDNVLNGRFKTYGTDWAKWSSLDNSIAYDYLGVRPYPKPGEYLLPSFGLCEVAEAHVDKLYTIVNKHRYVCEMSQHVLYHYILMIIWWVMVAGIIVSVFGIVRKFYDYGTLLAAAKRGRGLKDRKLRELEYLDFIYNKDMVLFGKIVRLLTSPQDEENDGTFPTAPEGIYKDIKM